MKHLKTIGLLAAVAASLLAFAGSAYAAEHEEAVLTSPAGTDYTGTIHLTLEAGSSTRFEAGIEHTCTADTLHGHITTNVNGVATGPTTSWLIGSAATPCSGEATTVLNPGSFSVASGGAVTASNNEVTFKEFGISCVYGGGESGTVLGTLEGGTPAKLKVNTTHLKKISGGLFCASEGTWTANYVVTTPSTLLVD